MTIHVNLLKCPEKEEIMVLENVFLYSNGNVGVAVVGIMDG